MKLLETTAKPAKTNITSSALRVITTNISSLLTWIKMPFIVGYVIIAVGVLGALLGALVLLSNFRNGTELRTGPILKDSLTYLWNKAMMDVRQKLNSRKNSQAYAPQTRPPQELTPSNIWKKED
tara:strand:+ start:2825 stop:3196 length:372 start_codon:yes stop_codon:yes gene_type:complete